MMLVAILFDEHISTDLLAPGVRAYRTQDRQSARRFFIALAGRFWPAD
jgi:hypothetical protein